MLLDNGVEISIDRAESRVTAIAVGVGVGSIYEEPHMRGISHLLEHMMFKSNKWISGEELDMTIEGLGGMANAFTGRDYTIYVFEVLSESAPSLIDVICKMMLNDKYSEDEFLSERDVVLSEIQLRDENPSSRIWDLGTQALFGRSDLGDPVTGYHETIGSVTLRDLVEHKARNYVGGNIKVAMVGNVGDEAVNAARACFSKIEPGRPDRKKPSMGSPRDVIERGRGDGAYISFSLAMDNEDPRSTYLRLALMEFQLSDGASSILFRNLRNKGLAYSFDVDWELFPGIAYMQAVVEAVEPDKLDSVLGQLRSAILEAHEFVGEDYLRRRRKYLEYVSASSLRNMFDRAYADSYFMLKGLPFNMPGYVDELSTAYWDRGNYAVGNASIATAIIN
ncbi:peptidase M16 [Thermocladium modestius]|uniref:Peptidase M16 n=1 Tax=Thermocladium modestius TaxID=62609 RepID=A0A830GU69_9CREN|nr:pitrilysin family protein [Thermocladium modestius]GGP21390.1 peptidase M16 [Thermocladium modestius]